MLVDLMPLPDVLSGAEEAAADEAADAPGVAGNVAGTVPTLTGAEWLIEGAPDAGPLAIVLEGTEVGAVLLSVQAEPESEVGVTPEDAEFEVEIEDTPDCILSGIVLNVFPVAALLLGETVRTAPAGWLAVLVLMPPSSLVKWEHRCKNG